MLILGLVCSPRSHGNTAILVQTALDAAEELGANVDLISMAEQQIAPCDGCNRCHASGVCCLEDDMQSIYPKLLLADGVILASPVYFWTVTAQAKILMDRTYALRYPYHQLRGKACGAIVVAGRRGCTGALSVINNFFLGQDMIPIGLGIAGYANQPGEIRRDKRAMTAAQSLGEQIYSFLSPS